MGLLDSCRDRRRWSGCRRGSAWWRRSRTERPRPLSAQSNSRQTSCISRTIASSAGTSIETESMKGGCMSSVAPSGSPRGEALGDGEELFPGLGACAIGQQAVVEGQFGPGRHGVEVPRPLRTACRSASAAEQGMGLCRRPTASAKVATSAMAIAPASIPSSGSTCGPPRPSTVTFQRITPLQALTMPSDVGSPAMPKS